MSQTNAETASFSASVALLPAARTCIILSGMAKPLAKLLLLLKPKRRWAQFTLRGFFVLVTILCVALGTWIVPAERQRRAVAAIEALHGRVTYADDTQTKATPTTLLRRWLPRDCFNEVRTVCLSSTAVTDAQLTNVEWLADLREFDLDVTQVTDAGLAHLRAMKRLKRLSLNGTQVTDAELAHLRALTALEWLQLNGTRVTGAGLDHLQAMADLELLCLKGTQVADPALVHLRPLTGLKMLDLRGTRVTDAGLAGLQQALPKCIALGPLPRR